MKTNVNYSLPHGDLIGTIDFSCGPILLRGENGVGKSTFLTNLISSPVKELKNKVIQLVPQKEVDVMSSVTVGEYYKYFDQNLERFIEKRKREEFFSFFNNLGLEDKNVLTLSGGEGQLFKLGLFIGFKADWYFFDEPFQFLDKAKKMDLQKFFEAFGNQNFLIVEHEFLKLNFEKKYKMKNKNKRIWIERER